MTNVASWLQLPSVSPGRPLSTEVSKSAKGGVTTTGVKPAKQISQRQSLGDSVPFSSLLLLLFDHYYFMIYFTALSHSSLQLSIWHR